jgi:uncharacterized membrane protein
MWTGARGATATEAAAPRRVAAGQRAAARDRVRLRGMTSHVPAHDPSGRPTHLRRTIARAKKRRGDLPPAPHELPLRDRLADAVAATVGSWRFILTQSALLVAWIAGNAVLGSGSWDPYPFILLNLMLSFQAAYTAPIIMMAQNRQADVDRDRAIADYQVNLRAEADITLLHEKLDLLRERQLMEMTQLLKHAIERIEQLETRRA